MVLNGRIMSHYALAVERIICKFCSEQSESPRGDGCPLQLGSCRNIEIKIFIAFNLYKVFLKVSQGNLTS